jgi:hypothetical protein
MAYSIHEFDMLIIKLDDANHRQRSQTQRAVALARTALDQTFALVPIARAEGDSILTHLTRMSQQVSSLVGSLVLDSRIVLDFWHAAEGWTALRAEASAAAGKLEPANRPAGAFWEGLAANAYRWVTPNQRSAVLRIDTVAHQVQVSLTWAAEAGVVFYLGALAPLVKLTAVVVAALPALVSGVGTLPAALALVVAFADVLSQLLAVITMAAIVYAWAKVHLNNVRSEGFDTSSFPNGRWPEPRTELYDDGTVSDGDPSDWRPATN